MPYGRVIATYSNQNWTTYEHQIDQLMQFVLLGICQWYSCPTSWRSSVPHKIGGSTAVSCLHCQSCCKSRVRMAKTCLDSCWWLYSVIPILVEFQMLVTATCIFKCYSHSAYWSDPKTYWHILWMTCFCYRRGLKQGYLQLLTLQNLAYWYASN